MFGQIRHVGSEIYGDMYYPYLVLLDEVGEFLPRLPALRPPRLLDLAGSILIGL
jgi:hypothetical protein